MIHYTFCALHAKLLISINYLQTDASVDDATDAPKKLRKKKKKAEEGAGEGAAGEGAAGEGAVGEGVSKEGAEAATQGEGGEGGEGEGGAAAEGKKSPVGKKFTCSLLIIIEPFINFTLHL